jgi:hypothetical protein
MMMSIISENTGVFAGIGFGLLAVIACSVRSLFKKTRKPDLYDDLENPPEPSDNAPLISQKENASRADKGDKSVKPDGSYSPFTGPPVFKPSVKSRPIMTYSERESFKDMSRWPREKSPMGEISLSKKFKDWAFQAFDGILLDVQDVTFLKRHCVVMYAVEYVGHPHPLVATFDNFKRLEGTNLAPRALYLSESREYESSRLDGIVSDHIVMDSERFIVCEYMSSSLVESYTGANWNDMEIVKKFFKSALEVLNLIRSLHRSGFYAGNLTIRSFCYRGSDGKLVFSDLSQAEPGFAGKNLFNKDLSVMIQILDIMDWDSAIVTSAMHDDYHEIFESLRDRDGLEHPPRYEIVQKILEKYI